MSFALNDSALFTTTTSAYKPTWAIADTRLHMPKWYLPVYLTTLVVSLALPRQTRIVLTLPIVIALISMLPFRTEGSFKKDFDFGNLVLGWFFFYLSLCFGAPEKQFWKKDGRSLTPEQRHTEHEAKSLREKLHWSWGIWTNPRGNGWSHEAPGMKALNQGPVW